MILTFWTELVIYIHIELKNWRKRAQKMQILMRTYYWLIGNRNPIPLVLGYDSESPGQHTQFKVSKLQDHLSKPITFADLLFAELERAKLRYEPVNIEWWPTHHVLYNKKQRTVKIVQRLTKFEAIRLPFFRVLWKTRRIAESIGQSSKLNLNMPKKTTLSSNISHCHLGIVHVINDNLMAELQLPHLAGLTEWSWDKGHMYCKRVSYRAKFG